MRPVTLTDQYHRVTFQKPGEFYLQKTETESYTKRQIGLSRSSKKYHNNTGLSKTLKLVHQNEKTTDVENDRSAIYPTQLSNNHSS